MVYIFVYSGPSTPTVLPTRNRILKLEVVDRPVADNAEVLTVMPVGRGYYLRVTYDAGTPFNREFEITIYEHFIKPFPFDFSIHIFYSYKHDNVYDNTTETCMHF